MKPFTHRTVKKPHVPAEPGIYRFYDKNKELLYVGHSKNLRHRVQSYKQADDFAAHPTKASLRPRIKYYAYQIMPVQRARRIERQIKKKTLHNHL